MNTISEHISQLFSGFNISLNMAALKEICMPLQIDPSSQYTVDIHNDVMRAILDFAPFLLLTPSSYSVSENGHSKSRGFDRNAFLRWYQAMCKKYGVEEDSSLGISIISDVTEIW